MHANTSCPLDVSTQALLDNIANAHLHKWHSHSIVDSFAALGDNNRKKKSSSRIRGITSKSTAAERIDKTEQDGPKSDKSDRHTDRQTDTNLLAFRSPIPSSANGSTLV